jgi:hypothetical protein
MSLAAVLVGAGSPAVAQSGDAQRFRVVFGGTTRSGAGVRGVSTGGRASNVVPEVLDPETGSFVETDRFTFSAGTLDVVFAGTVHGFFSDPRTCVARPSGSGTWDVVDSSGRYEGASGGGAFTFTAILVFPRGPQGCGEEPRFTLAVVDARGTLLLS